MTKHKKVRFDFFQATTIDDTKTRQMFNLTKLINDIYRLPIKERNMSLQGEFVKLDHVVTYDNGQTYFHISRYRDEGMAMGTIDSDDMVDMELDEDQFVIEDIGCLFDPEFSVLMIQRNFHSLSITGVQDYLINMYFKIHSGQDNQMTEEQEFKINNFEFSFVPDINVYDKVSKSKKFRTIYFKAGSIVEDDITPTFVQKLIGPFNKIKNTYNGYQVGISISAEPHGKDLDTEESQEFKDFVKENRGLFSSAIVRASNGDAPIEPFDLINGKLMCYDDFAITRTSGDKVKKVHLDSNAIEESMFRHYNGEEYGSYKEKARQGLVNH